MATNVSVSQLTGLFKEVYASGIRTLYPEVAKLMNELGDVSDDGRVGNLYHQPLIVAKEQGYTLGGNNGDAFAINSPIAMTSVDAQIQGSEAVLPSRISYRAAAKAAAGGAKSFKPAMSVVIKNNLASHGLRKELEMWYGKSPTGLGQVAAGAGSVSGSGTSRTVTYPAAQWAVGIWSGAENAQIQYYRDDTGALVGTNGTTDTVFTITAVDTVNKTLTVSGTTQGCSDLTTAITAAACDTTFYGYRGSTWTTYTEVEGIDYALTLAAGNTLWNVSTNYSLVRGNVYDCKSGALTFGKVLSGVQMAVGKAGLDEELTLFVSTDTYPSLADSFAASRQLDNSYDSSEGKNGVEKITYVGANGIIRVMPHPCIKGSEAFALPLKNGIVRKVGSTDITMQPPGRNAGEIFFDLPSNAGFEIRSYSDFAVFIAEPGKCMKFKNIVNP